MIPMELGGSSMRWIYLHILWLGELNKKSNVLGNKKIKVEINHLFKIKVGKFFWGNQILIKNRSLKRNRKIEYSHSIKILRGIKWENYQKL